MKSQVATDPGHLHVLLSMLTCLVPFVHSTAGVIVSGLFFIYCFGLIVLGRNECGSRPSVLTYMAGGISLMAMSLTLVIKYVFEFVLKDLPG
jgi:hypothetical protein